MGRDPYFDSMPERQAMLWAAAVRRQLGRWEPTVARYTLMSLHRGHTPKPEHEICMSTVEIWSGETERHLLLVAAANLVKALGQLDEPPSVDPVVAAEIGEVRDLNEHWDENMPVFNVGPTRSREPGRRSGKSFAERNQHRGPYCWWAWDVRRGPMVTPNVSATQLHELVEVAIGACLATRPDLADGVPEALPRPWCRDGWWPDPDAESE